MTASTTDQDILSATKLIWLESMRSQEKWGLTQKEAIILLGRRSPSTYNSWLIKAETNGRIRLGIDLRARLTLLMDIHNALSLSAPSGDAYSGFKHPINNTVFQEKSIKEYLLEDSTILKIDTIQKILLKKGSRSEKK
jgi:hypothetical protein|tara:strand:- start:11856 stop:12269 length:414 start_codon:yes stop_codon:yes gene_type:complete